MRDVNYGWLLRYLHANGASMFFIAVYIHIFRGLYYGSYKAPREILWILGVIIYLLMMATAFMGYVLPWGQMSFWGATVITNIFAAIPVVGETIQSLLWGGYSVGNPTLNRFFSLHYLLPFMIVGVVDPAHLGAARAGPQQPDRRRGEVRQGHGALPRPTRRSRTASRSSCFLIFFAWFVFYMPNYLGHADNYIPANPPVTPAHIVPEWYFLPFYAILRAIPDKLGGVIAMFGSIAVLAFVPWLDTSKVRSAAYRPLYRQFFWVFVVDCVLLGWLGSKPPEGGYVIASQDRDGLLLRPLPDHPAAARLRSRRRGRCRTRSSNAVLGKRKRARRSPAGATAAPQPRAERAPETDDHDQAVPSRRRRRWLGALRRRRSPAEGTPVAAAAQAGASTGPFGTFDRAQLQRGFKVYREVCAACHGLELRRLPQPRGAGRPGVLRGAGQGARRRVQDQGRAERCRRDVRAPGRPADRFPRRSRTSRRPRPPTAARRRRTCR